VWSSPLELYPVHILPAPQGQVFIAEPKVEYQLQAYVQIQPTKGPYQMQMFPYSKRLWIC